MILQTGGLAMGETSTRSRPNSTALARATSRGRTPNCSPSGPITLSSRARMRRFVRASRMADSWRKLTCVENDSGETPGIQGSAGRTCDDEGEIPLKSPRMVATAGAVSRRQAGVRHAGCALPEIRIVSPDLSKAHGCFGGKLLDERVERGEAEVGFLALAVLAR